MGFTQAVWREVWVSEAQVMAPWHGLGKNVTNTELLRVSVVKFGLLFYKNKLVDLKELVV